MEHQSLATEIEDACKQYSTAPCIVSPSGELISFATYFNLVLSFAERLYTLGIRPGHVVAVKVNRYEFSFALRLAVLRLGAICFSLREVDAAGTSGVKIDKVVSLREQPTGHPREVFFTEDWMSPPHGYIPVQAGGGFVHATSGSTGVPKLRFDTDRVFRARIASNRALRGPFSGPVFNAQNIATLIGQKAAIGALLEGKLQLCMRDSAIDSLRALNHYKVTDAYIPPLHLRNLLEGAEESELYFPDLKRINVGGGAVSQRFACRCEDAFSAALFCDYGSTETDTIATGRIAKNQEERMIFPQIYPDTKIRIDKSNNNLIQVWVPPQRRTEAFFKDEILFDQNGWRKLDDCGAFTKDGALEVIGRASDVINAGGNKFAPHVLETHADGFPDIKEIVAFKVRSETSIDEIGFAVVFADAPAPEALKQYLVRKIGSMYSIHIFPVSKIQRTQGGKIDRIELTLRYSQLR